MDEINHGVLLGQRSTDFAGGTLPYEVMVPSGDWTPYLPPGEWQRNHYFDTFGCVSFSALNSIECQYKLLTGTERNFSDRFTVVMSGTIPGSGNYLWKVAESLRKDGAVDESLFPAPANYSQSTYYTPVPIEVINKAKEFVQEWDTSYEFIDNSKESIMYHLKQSPIQIVIPGHAVLEFINEQQVEKYMDSYEPFIKDRTQPLQTAMKLVLRRKQKYMTEKDVKRLQALEGYSDPAGVAYWAGKELDQYLTARLNDKLINIQSAQQ